MSACRRHYPGRIDGTDSLSASPPTSAFPTLQLGRLLHYIFRGLLSVHSRYDLQTRQVALCDPLHRRLRRLCYLHRRSDCYRVERSSSRAGLAPAVVQCLSRRTVNAWLRKLSRLLSQPGFPVVDYFGVSSPGESHPEALAELYVSLSTHTAPFMEPRRAPICQWANNSGARREMRAIQWVARRRWRRSFLYFRLAQRARSRSSPRIGG